MKIVVLHGSPKGERSITRHYIKYLQKHFQEHEFSILPISHEIKTIKSDQEYFRHILDVISAADGVIWASPVYFLNIPGQYKQFIELLFERQVESVFERKYTAVFMSSIHFYDNFAADYLHGICDDLKMRYTGEFLAEMNDFRAPRIRQQLLAFGEYFFYAIRENVPTSIHYMPIAEHSRIYLPSRQDVVPKSREKRLVILHDTPARENNLSRMIDVFTQAMPYVTQTFHLREIGKKGGCLECLEHGCDNDCRYIKPFTQFYEKYLFMADAVIFAGSIKDRYLSASWKLFFDRTFVYGHTPTLAGKPIGFLLSGSLSQIPNLRETLKAYAQLISQSSMVDMVTDEYSSSEQLTAVLQGFAEKFTWTIERNTKLPVNFYGHAGRLIFRDFIHLAHGIFVPDQQYHTVKHFYEFLHPATHMPASKGFRKLLHKLPLPARWRRETVRESTIKGLQRIIEET